MSPSTPPCADYRWRANAAVASLVLLGVVACKGDSARADSAGPPPAPADSSGGGSLALPVTGAPVRRADLVLTISTTGQVRSAAVSQLKAETNGNVDAVAVRPGAVVKRGDVLVRLDTRPFDLAVREAEAALQEARIRLQANLAGDSALLSTREDAERQANAAALSGIPGAEVRLERAKLDRERAVITAPFNGVVDRVEVAAGSRVSPGQDIATVVDVAHLRVEAQVLEHDLPAVKIGGLALISTPATGGSPVRGRITAVLPLVDSITRAGRVVVSPEALSVARLQPGMYADLRLEASRLPSRILVPARAVIERDGRPLVFIARHGRAQWVYLTPGQSNGTETEVLPDSSTGQVPVAVGDTVLVEGHLTLTHDAPVRVTVPTRP